MDGADIIIVGAGSAGCVLANRLSADPRCRVVLIEAGGPDRNPLLRIPLMAGLAYFHRPINWNYETVAQPGLGGRAMRWPRGKVVGGTSAINGMMYMRGDRTDFDGWAAEGLPGWGYDDVLPYFLRSEDAPDRADSPYHATGGPLRVSRARGVHPMADDFLGACRAAGLADNDDFNGAVQDGCGFNDFTIRDGRRESSATAFLRPALRRPNLTVLTRTLVRRIIVEAGRATAVEVDGPAGRRRIAAAREVVLCGGAVNSPHLLQLSGIGAGAALKAAGIDPVHELPGVGRNLQDHLGVFLSFACRDPVTLYRLFRPDRAALALLRAWATGRGPGAAVPLEAGAFARTREGLDRPDVKLTFVPGLNLETTRAGQGRHGYLISVYQLRPESRGTVMADGPDPRRAPRIDPGYLSAAGDLRCLMGGVALAARIAARPPLVNRQAGHIAPDATTLADAAALADWIRAKANTVYHPAGSCRMGTGPEAVVDGALRVHGLQGLRVADASVMPQLIAGNTAAPTMMIAEKAAALILGRA